MKAFTILELVIVITALSILAAMTIPSYIDQSSYHSYKLQNGEVVKCKLEVGSWGSLDLTYCENGKEYKNLTNVEKLSE